MAFESTMTMVFGPFGGVLHYARGVAFSARSQSCACLVLSWVSCAATVNTPAPGAMLTNLRVTQVSNGD